MDFFNNTSIVNRTVEESVRDTQMSASELQIYNLMESIIGMGLTSVVSAGGMVANIINIIVFSGIGILSHSNTVSLTAISLSDLVCCLFVLWSNICNCINIYFNSPDLKWDVNSFYIYSSLTPKLVFIQTTCWITNYIAVERFVAIVFPFQVKKIFTAKTTLIFNACVFVSTCVLYYRQYTSALPRWVKNPTTNATILKYVTTGVIDVRDKATNLGFLSMYVAFRLLSFAIIAVCNATMLWKLSVRKFKKLHAKSPAASSTTATKTNTALKSEEKGGEGNSLSNTKPKMDKDKRIISMMATICSVFIICYTPDIVNVTMYNIMPLLNFEEFDDIYYYWLNQWSTLLETINSSCNLFIYYTMSTQYRHQFLIVFSGWRKKK